MEQKQEKSALIAEMTQRGRKKTRVGQTCEQQLMLRDEVTASFPFMTIRELAAAASAAVNE